VISSRLLGYVALTRAFLGRCSN